MQARALRSLEGDSPRHELFIVPRLKESKMSMPSFVKNYGPAILLILAVLGIAIGAVRTIDTQILNQTTDFNTQISKVRDDIALVDKRMTKVEGAVKALGDNQSNPLKGLIHDLLAAATNALPNKPEVAARAISAADSLIVTLKKEKRSADAEYFQNMVSAIHELTDRIPRAKSAGPTQQNTLRQLVYSTKISLAEYRSAITPVPIIPKRVGQLPENLPFTLTIAAYPVLTTINFSPPKPVTVEGNGAALDARGMHPGQEMLIVATRSLEQNPVIMKNLILIGATQTLDYVTWENVTFVGTHIKSQGGPVRLANVRFVNCTFDLPHDDTGARIAEYAALESKQTVKVG